LLYSAPSPLATLTKIKTSIQFIPVTLSSVPVRFFRPILHMALNSVIQKPQLTRIERLGEMKTEERIADSLCEASSRNVIWF